MSKLQWVPILAMVFLSGCKDPMNNLYKYIRNFGYIAYHTPLEAGGTGTMLAGDEKNLVLIAPPQTCFPDQVDGVPTHLRVISDSGLPIRDYFMSFDAKLGLEMVKAMPVDKPDVLSTVTLPGLAPLPISDALLEQLIPNWPLPIQNSDGSASDNTGAPQMTMELGVAFNKIKKFNITVEGAQVEYMDSVKLIEFYHKNMTSECRTYLEQVGFVIQAIKVQKLRFSFESTKGGLIDLSLGNIGELIRIDPRIEWKVVKKVYLEFNSPRYIGYQLGRLRQEDGGLAFYRATKTKKNKFIYQKVGIFDE